MLEPAYFCLDDMERHRPGIWNLRQLRSLMLASARSYDTEWGALSVLPDLPQLSGFLDVRRTVSRIERVLCARRSHNVQDTAI